jgi:2-iminobutanoate/2-iminopropanoate deaminase
VVTEVDRANLNPDGMAPPLGPYVHAVKISKPESLVFVSGCIALDERGGIVGPGDIGVQTRQAMLNLKACLEAAGAAFTDVVKITNYVIDARDYPKIAPVRAEFLSEPYPASTMVEVKGLIFPGLLIEIESVAVVGSGKKG